MVYNINNLVDKFWKKVDILARKAVEKNISFDDIKKKYYVNFDYGKVGSIVIGKNADIIVANKELDIEHVIFNGNLIKW